MSKEISKWVTNTSGKRLIEATVHICSDFKPNAETITFYDVTDVEKRGWKQRISSYYLETFMERSDVGLDMYGGVPEWTIDADTVNFLQEWIRNKWSVGIPQSFFDVWEDMMKFNMGLWLKVHPMIVYNTKTNIWSIQPMAFQTLCSDELWFEFRKFHDYFEDKTSNAPNPENLEKRYNEFMEKAKKNIESFKGKVGA